MHQDVTVLRELLLLAGFSLFVLLALQRLRVPAAVGFITTGVLVGPGGFALIHDLALVHALADFGVMFLLFTVGLEFSRHELLDLRRTALLGGALQVTLTGGIVAVAGLIARLHPAQAIFVGMLASLSSTALVLRLLTDRLELSAPHGRVTTGVLVFQDLLVIPFAIAVPWLVRWHTGGGGTSGGSLLGTIAQLVMVALVFAVAHRVVPWMLARALRTRSREAFLFGVVVVALGSAFLTASLGLSMALGAFLAGMIVAESDLRSHVEAGVVSFRDALTGVFFVAIGMLFDPRSMISHPVLILASTLGLVGAKLAVTALGLKAAGVPGRVALASGFTLAQVGEFSFMLAGSAPNLLGTTGGQAFFSGALFSLLLTPILVSRAGEWSQSLAARWSRAAPARDVAAAADGLALVDHVVIAGFGLNGRNVARVLRSTRVAHLVVDLDPDALEAAAEGSRRMLGDITQPEIQRRAGVEDARVLVLALSDPVATRHACRIARALSPALFILVRTRYVAELDELHRLGANQVIPEEFETSIEILTAVLRHFHVPGNIIHAQARLLREERYSLLRGLKLPGSVMEQLDTILSQGICDTFLLLQHSPAVDRTLGDLGLLGDRPGARVVALVRGGAAMTTLEPSFVLRVGDILVMTGTHAAMEEAFRRLSPARSS